MSRTNFSARACCWGETPGVPLRSIGFVGSYGFGPATVVGVRRAVVGVGAEVAGVGAEVAGVVPPKGTYTAPVSFGVVVDPVDRRDAVLGVVCFLADFFFDFLADDFAEVDVFADELDDSADGLVGRGPTLTRSLLPLEHAPTSIITTMAAHAAMLVRIFGVGMAAAYAPGSFGAERLGGPDAGRGVRGPGRG